MKKELILSNKNSSLALGRTKSLLNITNKLLANRNSDLVDNSWIDRLWEWADENLWDGYKDYCIFNRSDGLRTETFVDILISEKNCIIGISKDKKILLSSKGLFLPSISRWDFPLEICYLRNLEVLDYGFFDGRATNFCETIPKKIGNLINLKVLNLAGNDIIELPSTIGNLKKLIYLKLSDNNLKKLPSTIGNLVNLEILDLKDNYELKKLPITL